MTDTTPNKKPTTENKTTQASAQPNNETPKKTQTKRTKDQIIASYDTKISYHQACISKLQEKKEKTINPSFRSELNQVMKEARNKGLNIEEIKRRLLS